MDRVRKRFDELDGIATGIIAGYRSEIQNVAGYGLPQRLDEMDYKLALQWETSARSLIFQVFGKTSPVYEEFDSESQAGGGHVRFDGMHAVFLSAKDQFENGHLFDLRNLVQAEVFSDELEQARYFLDGGHMLPAAVIAGTVLESTLRTLCDEHPDIELRPKTTLNPMNDELAKNSVYNATRKKQITAWAGLRNDAAHGKPEFRDNTKDDIKRMIDGIEDFVANHLS